MSSSSTNIYSAQPALPVLASSLLPPPSSPSQPQLPQSQPSSRPSSSRSAAATGAGEAATSPFPHQQQEQQQQQQHQHHDAVKNAWNLRADIEEGVVIPIQSRSQSRAGTGTGTRTQREKKKESVFRCGIVIGVSVLKEKERGGDGFEVGGRGEWVGELPRHLLSTTLLRKEAESPRTRKDPQTTTETEPKAFIIHPSNSSTFAPETLLASLLSRGQHHHHYYHHHHQDEPSIISRDEAIELLDAVQLLPVFDFPGAVQAISDVSDRLHRMQQARRRQQQQQQQQKDEEEKEEGVDPDTDTETTDGGGGGGHHQPVLLIIEGLDALAEGVIRTSNPLRGSAVLVPALRTLTHLARTYASFLSVILVNTSGLGGGGFVAQGQPQPQAQSQGQIQDKNGGEGIHSVFFRPGMTSPLLPTLLSRSLDQGLDVHLLLSTVRGRRIVEVIKDRVGASVGRWCVWDGNGDG